MQTTNWLLRAWYRYRLKEQQSSPFKIKSEMDLLKSNTILDILNQIMPIWLSVKALNYKLGIKEIQNNRASTQRDEFGKQKTFDIPLFSQNQIADITTKYIMYYVATIGFVIAESALYFLTASLFVPGAPTYVKIGVAIFLATLIMLALSYGFEKHYLYQHAAERQNTKDISSFELKRIQGIRNWGYALIVLSFAAILFSSFARIFFFEYIPMQGLDPQKMHSIEQASRMASVFTLLITIIAAIAIALIKQEQAKIGVQFRVFKYWRNAHMRRNTYMQKLIKEGNKILLTIEQIVDKHWQLAIDVKKTFKMETEYDPKYEKLHAEYEVLRSTQSFYLTEQIYIKYSVLQGAYEELFKYGILHSKEIGEKIVFVTTILKIPEAHVAEHLFSNLNGVAKIDLNIPVFVHNSNHSHK